MCWNIRLNQSFCFCFFNWQFVVFVATLSGATNEPPPTTTAFPVTSDSTSKGRQSVIKELSTHTFVLSFFNGKWVEEIEAIGVLTANTHVRASLAHHKFSAEPPPTTYVTLLHCVYALCVRKRKLLKRATSRKVVLDSAVSSWLERKYLALDSASSISTVNAITKNI